jgi:membrane fusion protein (multidrug efflux system)
MRLNLNTPILSHSNTPLGSEGPTQPVFLSHILSNIRLFAVAGMVLSLVGCQKPQRSTTAPPEVEVMEVAQKNVPIFSEWVGTLEGFINADIQPRVTGHLISHDYREGSFVKKGTLLFQIDPRPLQIVLDQAKARLAQAMVALDKTELEVRRLTPLAQKELVSQQELDNAIHAYYANKAAAEAERAEVAQAELNLSYTKITSPIDGIAGIAEAEIGDLVGPTTRLTTISAVDPIKVHFSVSEQEYLSYVRENPDGAKRAAPEGRLELELILADGSLYPHKGRFFLADRQVDASTGALPLQGLFPNSEGILRPGLYARVRAITKTKKGALLVPQRAVIEVQGSYQVVVVGRDQKVEIRSVKVGERIGSMWIIDEGLKPGERVVVEGILRVKAGMTVKPKPFRVKAATEFAPVKAGPA